MYTELFILCLTLFAVHGILNTVLSASYTEQCIHYYLHKTLFSVNCMLNTVFSTLYAEHCVHNVVPQTQFKLKVLAVYCLQLILL